MTKLLTATAFMLVPLLAGAPARAHIKITYPPARYAYTGGGQKVPPCGQGALSNVVTPLVAGDALTVTWDEIINHPGHFRIALDTDDNGKDDFVDPKDEKDMTVSGNVIAYVPDNGGSKFQHTFTLPNITCQKCTLQVLQVMTDKLGDGFTPEGDLYHWCSEVKLTQKGMGQGGAGGTGTTGAGGTGTTGAGGLGAGVGGSTGTPVGTPQSGSEQESRGGCSFSARAATTRATALLLLLLAGARVLRRRS